jgi:hypothetical protein
VSFLSLQGDIDPKTEIRGLSFIFLENNFFNRVSIDDWSSMAFKLHLCCKVNSMTNEQKKNEANNDNKISQPDPETLHTTDPQENMEGPVSSLMHETGEAFDTDTTQEEADEKKAEGGI